MKIGISTGVIKLYDKPLYEYLSMLKSCGFSVVELDAHNHHSFPYRDSQFIKLLTHRLICEDIYVHSIHAPFHFSFADPDPRVRKQGIKETLILMEGILPLLEELSLKPYLVIHPGHHLTRTSSYEQECCLLESLYSLFSNSLSSKFNFVIENMLSSHFGAKTEELLRIISKVRPNLLGVCFDSSHCVYDSSPQDFIEELGIHIKTTHISDNYHQPHGEFHAIPMTLRHSRIQWKELFTALSRKLDTIIFELIPPNYWDNDIYIKMAQLSAEQAFRLIEH